MGRSLPFQGGETGSSPVGATKNWVGCYKVWQRIVNPSGIPTAGSIPARPTNNPRVAQLVEHGIEDPGVGGSTPSPRTINAGVEYD